jgi:hypothetical protein
MPHRAFVLPRSLSRNRHDDDDDGDSSSEVADDQGDQGQNTMADNSARMAVKSARSAILRRRFGGS